VRTAVHFSIAGKAGRPKNLFASRLIQDGYRRRRILKAPENFSPMAHLIYVLNGPNLNMLGLREPAIYGRDTLEDIKSLCERSAKTHGLAIDFRQSNIEGEIVNWIQEARDKAKGIILNAGAYTHTSVAILDALQAAERPTIEVHLSNIFRRDQFRQHSYVSLAAMGVICGLGAKGYELALEAMAHLLASGETQ
jgi:3-dehydroquinate dehydratase-2